LHLNACVKKNDLVFLDDKGNIIFLFYLNSADENLKYRF